MGNKMTPKEKSIELFNRFSNTANSYIEGKKCALIAVNELIEAFTNTCCESYNVRYWKEVKQEISEL